MTAENRRNGRLKPAVPSYVNESRKGRRKSAEGLRKKGALLMPLRSASIMTMFGSVINTLARFILDSLCRLG